ncbi:hypothetical protein Tco_0431960 [Tanacetum coccineum]
MPFPHSLDKLLTLVASVLPWMGPLVHFLHREASSILLFSVWGGSISLESFLSSIMLLVVMIVAVVIVVVAVILVVVVVEVLGTVATGKYRFSLFKPTDDANSAFYTFKIESICRGSSLCFKSSTETYQQQVFPNRQPDEHAVL